MGRQAVNTAMRFEDSRNDSLVMKAVKGNKGAINNLLVSYRKQLRNLADSMLSNRIRRREDPSDIVQLTYYEAYRDIKRFRGRSRPEFLGWLRQILVRNLYNSARTHRCAKRNVSNEIEFEGGADQTGSVPALHCQSPRLSDSDVEWQEVKDELHDALQHLTSEQREAVTLRYSEGLSVHVIANRLNRSPSATAGLAKRGMKTLRAIMRNSA